ncbi:MAG: ABC transporter ATP-binding protein [Pseudomonadota bacterium]
MRIIETMDAARAQGSARPAAVPQGLRFEDIHYSYGGVPALRGITLDAREGEILCLLGRSGCGKSTLLNLAAGILPLQCGAITLAGRTLATPALNPPPERRSVGLVFQDGALFLHLTVAQNIGFGLRERAVRQRTVEELLDQIGLAGMGARYPHTLSGGQQQRVAVARALAPSPDVLLMDEPYASIDISLRRKLREETRRLVKSRGCATILVTHDPEEALEIADRIAVMEQGRITQAGTGRELYADPASLFVGLMAGSGAVLKARLEGGAARTRYGRFARAQLSVRDADRSAERLDILIRPHAARLEADPDGLLITDIRHTGRSQIVTLSSAEADGLLLEIAPEPAWTVGQTVSIAPSGPPWPAFAR